MVTSEEIEEVAVDYELIWSHDDANIPNKMRQEILSSVSLCETLWIPGSAPATLLYFQIYVGTRVAYKSFLSRGTEWISEIEYAFGILSAPGVGNGDGVGKG